MIATQPSARAQQLIEDTYGRINTIDTLLRLKDQVFTEADLRQFGPDLYAVFRQIGVTGMWMKLRGCSLARAIIEIASALDGIGPSVRSWLLREVGEAAADSEAAIERAKQAATLVILDQPRTAYFQGQELDVEWDEHPVCWEYLELLARASAANKSVDYMSLGSDASPDLPKHRKRNLKKLEGVPVALISLIESAGRGTQRLKLLPAQVRIFEQTGNGEYREWSP